LRTALGRALVLAFASQVALTVAGAEMATLVYGTNRITPDQITELSMVLGGFALSVAAWTAQTLVSRGFYAQGRAWTPTWVGFLFMAASFLLYRLAAERWGSLGLTLTSSGMITAYVATLYLMLRRGLPAGRGLAGLVAKLVLATAMACLSGYALRNYGLGPFAFGRIEALWRITLLGGVSAAVFLAATTALRVGEVADLVRPILRRFSRPPQTSPTE
jgi:putative peptidoglycan lipid II flippase